MHQSMTIAGEIRAVWASRVGSHRVPFLSFREGNSVQCGAPERTLRGAAAIDARDGRTDAHLQRRHSHSWLQASILFLSVLLPAASSPVAALAQTLPLPLSAEHNPFGALIAEASRRFGIPTNWIRAVMGFESSNNPLAVSPKGAMGLMQIMPSTWRELRVRYALGDNPVDPRANVHAGAAYLREMHERYRSITGMLAAYNAGPARYDDYLSTGRPLSAETRDYVNALAPLLGGEPLDATSSVVASSTDDWRDAPLFVAQPNIQPAAPFVQPGSTPESAESAPDWHADDAIRPRANGLFIAHSRAGGVR